jgi:hypothetical protein
MGHMKARLEDPARACHRAETLLNTTFDQGTKRFRPEIVPFKGTVA